VAKSRRKTRAEQEYERAAAEQRAWEEFRPKLEALKTFEEAAQLVDEAPRPGTPGRRFYSNLGYFLRCFGPPAGASQAEKALYTQLLRRLDEAGQLKPGVRQSREDALRRAIQEDRDRGKP
jgi:hypothetical protein